MYDVDIQEILSLLRTAVVEEDWTVIDEVIDLIQRSINEKEFNKVTTEWE